MTPKRCLHGTACVVQLKHGLESTATLKAEQAPWAHEQELVEAQESLQKIAEESAAKAQEADEKEKSMKETFDKLMLAKEQLEEQNRRFEENARSLATTQVGKVKFGRDDSESDRHATHPRCSRHDPQRAQHRSVQGTGSTLASLSAHLGRCELTASWM